MDSVHSLIDISDGLAGDLEHVLKASGVGAEVYVERIPMPKGAKLGGGEDYELLFTASPRVKLPKKIHGVLVTRIGKITGRGGGLASSTSRGERRAAGSGLKLLDARGRQIKGINAFRHF